MIIYQKFGCHYCNAYIKTENGKWKSISELEVMGFLREAVGKDVEITIDGCAKFLSAYK